MLLNGGLSADASYYWFGYSSSSAMGFATEAEGAALALGEVRFEGRKPVIRPVIDSSGTYLFLSSSLSCSELYSSEP